MNKNTLEDNILYIIGEYLWLFIISGLCFFIVNIPLIFCSYVYIKSKSYMIFKIIMVLSVFCGPSILALFYEMNKVIEKNDISNNVMKNFFRGYKKNFFEGIFYWSLILIAYMVFNFYFRNLKPLGGINSEVFRGVLLGSKILFFAFVVIAFDVISVIYIRAKRVIRITFLLCKSNLKIFVEIIAIILIFYYFINSISSIFIIFVSFFCYIIAYVSRPILTETKREFFNIEI
ncbi:DUF624 domain-containing protein [Clostridium felsineum]|uniref:Uncharacterized protein n=1 Tax=Clostridium felsineum TaxID=36839 RepID=A0A1S8KYY0_9CLOT|nr:DUF624 domain-containing protein [Clostridium felsineum]URZ07837.1 hypothetical protein CLROS_031980 [Clostridium felsineum]URZ12868.1 hypothetical protein CROST_036130 [Clostridium felsineum]